MAKRLAPELGNIYENLLTLLTAVGTLLLDDQLAAHSKSIAECMEGISTSCRSLRLAGMSVTWEQCILAFRGLERSTSLIAAVNSLVLARSKAQPYAALVHDAVTELAQWLDAVKKKGEGFSRHRQAYISGPVMDLRSRGSAHGAPFAFGVTSASGRKMLIGGIGADVLDLLEDWAKCLAAYGSVDTSLPRRVAAGAPWDTASSSLGLNWLRRTDWPCGRLMNVGEFAAATGMSSRRVRGMIGRNELLALRTWDGSTVLPEVQLVTGTPSTVRPYLVRLLAEVRHDAGDSWWPLALWLGTSTQGTVHADLLNTEAGYGQMIPMLDRREILKDTAVPPKPLTHLPGRGFIGQAFHHLPRARMRGNAAIEYAYYNNAAEADEIDPPDGDCAYRITDRRHGPFYFRSARPRLGNGGRFDLPCVGHGTCYLAESAEGAFSEVTRRLLVLDIQQVASRVLWRLVPMDDQSDLLDLTADEVRHKLGYQSTDNLYGSRSASQSLAHMAMEEGFKGIRYPLRHLEGHAGWALFATSGPHPPELVGRGSWSVHATPVADSEDFWNWVVAVIGNPQDLYFIFNQLPLSPVF